MVAVNDITGDSLVSRTSEAYRNNYDAIFGKKKGNNSEQRSRCDDGQLAGTDQSNGEQSKTESGTTMEDETITAHDRLPTNSEH